MKFLQDLSEKHYEIMDYIYMAVGLLSLAAALVLLAIF